MSKMSNTSIATLNRSRRRFITSTAAAITATAALPFTASLAHASTQARRLSFYHTHTGEKLAIDYHDGASYIPGAMDEINHYLRDFRTDEAHTIDMKLLDVLHDLKVSTGSNGTFEVISGYRSPTTNAKLRNKSNGVAKRSLHMQGKAIDIRLSGYDTRELHKACKSLSKGGVGYYQKSDFIHVDTGRVRYW